MSTEDEFARAYPHLAPLAKDLERVLGIIKSQNRGWARVCFDVQGIDIQDHLIVKDIETALRFKRQKSA